MQHNENSAFSQEKSLISETAKLNTDRKQKFREFKKIIIGHNHSVFKSVLKKGTRNNLLLAVSKIIVSKTNLDVNFGKVGNFVLWAIFFKTQLNTCTWDKKAHNFSYLEFVFQKKRRKSSSFVDAASVKKFLTVSFAILNVFHEQAKTAV